MMIEPRSFAQNPNKNYTVVIPDIHGRLDHLNPALEWVKHYMRKENTTVVFTGDYVDRGPESYQVIEAVKDFRDNSGWYVKTLAGNHEDMMLGAIRDPMSNKAGSWTANGGMQTIASYPGGKFDIHEEFLASLDLIHRDRHRIYVHAAVDPLMVDFLSKMKLGTSDNQRVAQFAMWNRWNDYDESPFNVSDRIHVVHGHTPLKEAKVFEWRTNLDSACVFGYHLSVGIFDDDIPGGPVDIIKFIKEGSRSDPNFG